jgi:hypothetical protein
MMQFTGTNAGASWVCRDQETAANIEAEPS